MANILGSPNDISQTPWGFGGTGASVTSATTIQTAATGTCSLDQQLTLVAGATYNCSITVRGSVAAGNVFAAIYANDFSVTYGETTVSITTSAQVINFTATIPSGVTLGWFDADFNSTSSAIETVTNASVSLAAKGGSMLLVGVGT